MDRKRLAQAAAQAANLAKPYVKNMVKQALTSGGQSVGAMVGGKFGAPMVGAKVGSMLGRRIASLIGSGDYRATGLTAHNSLIQNNIPATISFTDRTIRIAHREYVCDIVTSSDSSFKSDQFVVNANYTTTFPYLSGIATQFEKYRFKGLVFEFISTTTPYATAGTTVGTVVMACQFNTANPDFNSKTQMENVENAISVRLDQNALYGVECKDQVQNWYYTRHLGAGANEATNVSNIYDLCDFSIATVGSPGSSKPVGELWVTYDVELTGPRLPDVRYGYLHVSCTDPSTGYPFGGSSRNVVRSGILAQSTINSSSVDSVDFNNVLVGDILSVDYTYKAATAGSNLLGLTLTNCEYVKILANGTVGVLAEPAVSTSTTTAGLSAYIRITGIGARMTFSTATLGGTGSATGDLVVACIAFSVKDSVLWGLDPGPLPDVSQPTDVVKWEFMYIVGTPGIARYLADPSGLVSVVTLNGGFFSSNLTGGYIQFGSVGLFFVSVMCLGSRASPGLGSVVLNASQCTFFPMENFTFPPSGNFSMAYLVTTATATASFRPYISSTQSSQTIEFTVSIVRLVPD